MRLLYLANARLPTEKAHGIQIMKMCEAFAETGLSVELVVPRRFDERGFDLYDFYFVRRTFKITQLRTLDLYGFGVFGYVVRTISFSLAALCYALRSSADVLYSRDDVPLAFASLSGKKVFFEVHTAKTGFFSRMALRRALGVIFISEGLKRFFEQRQWLRSRALVAPDGVDLSLFEGITSGKRELRRELKLPADAHIIGYIGKYRTMGKDKGVGMLISSFAKLAPRYPKFFLLLVGIYREELPEVRALFASLQVPEERYRIVPHVDQRKAFRYLKACDVLIMNYPDIPHYARYMSPLKLFEYMASGVPFITTDLPSIREVVSEQEAFFVPPRSETALMSAIETALRDPNTARRKTEAARIAVQKHTWHNRAARIRAFLEGRDRL